VIPDRTKVESIWTARRTSEEEILHGDIYNIIPVTLNGRLGLGLYVTGLLVFLAGIVLGSSGHGSASYVAVAGMVLSFGGGLWRSYTD
jgi:hypothetical protein